MAIFTVTNTSDSGPGSLRDAIQQAENRAGPDEIEFDPGLSGQTIFVTSGPLQIRSDLNIRGLSGASGKLFTGFGPRRVEAGLGSAREHGHDPSSAGVGR